MTRKRRIFTYRHRKTEPTGVRIGRWRRQNQELFPALQPFFQQLEILPAGLDESGQLLELSHAHRRLQIGRLEIVANM